MLNPISGNRMRLILSLCVLVTTVHAQLPLNQWPEKLKAFYELHNPVKLHLQFNQPVYAPGDTAYFRVAYLLAADASPLKGFNLIELDVVDADGKAQLHQLVRIRDGWGNNQIVLPENFAPGIYRVIAYDNWMKNFDRSRYFEGQLQVAGEYVYAPSGETEKLTSYAEGGRLVAGVQNKVVVHTSANQKVTVTDAAGKRLADFSTDRNGYGLFFLTPHNDQVYTVEAGTLREKLAAVPDGVSVLVTPAASGTATHRIVLQTPASSAFRSEPLNVVISGHGAVYYSASFTFNEKEFVNLAVSPAALPHGVCYLSVNRQNGETLANRVFLNMKHNIKVAVAPGQPEYGTRADVRVDLSLTDEENNPVLARMSVSVYQADIFPAYDDLKKGTEQYFSWISDLNEGPSPGFEANLKTAEGLLMIDRILVTKSWPWYTWEKVLSKQTKPQFLFRDYQQVTGRLVETPSGNPFADSVNITFYVTGTQDVYEVTSNKDGTFGVSFMFPFYRQEEIFYRVERTGRRIENIKVELSQTVKRYSVAQAVRTSGTNPYYTYSQKRKLVNTSFGYFSQGLKRIEDVGGGNALVEKELFKPDVEVDLDDYLLFPTMQETLHEIVPYLQYRKIGGRDVVRLYLPEKAQTGTENPAFFIDGVLTDDPSYFLKLKPVEVDKIKLVYSAYKLDKLGSISKNGVVLVETKIQNNAKNVSAATRSVKVDGITPSLPIPKEPAGWQKNNLRAPQLKSWLTWIPHLRSDENGRTSFSFKTADDTGRFVIRLEGITVEGIPFVAEEFIEVDYSREH